MGIVKYTGPVASFHCPTNAEIRSLKVHFSPKQEGTGDPSPENVREIVGWDGVVVKQSGKNLFDANAEFFQVRGARYYSKIIPNNVLCNVSFKLKNSLIDLSKVYFGFALDSNDIELGYNWVMKNGSIQSNKTNKAPGNKLCTYMTFYPNTMETFESLTQAYDIQIELGAETPYEPYQGSTTNYEFEVLGKNKLDVNGYTQLQSASFNNNYLTNINTDTRDNFQLSVVGYNGSTMLGQLFGQINMPTGAYSNTFVLSNTYENMDSIYIKHNGSTRDIGIKIPVDLVVGQTYTISMDVTGNDPTTVGGLSFGNIQIELGSTATAYEPYDPKHTVYGGWVDLITGEVCEEMTCVIIDGTQTIQAREKYENSNWFRVPRSQFELIPYGYYGNEICSYLKPAMNITQSGDYYPWMFFINSSTNAFHFSFPTSYDLTAVQSYIQENPLQICYYIAPITYHIAPTALQTFLGHNNVWSNADYVEVEYDLHETQDILNRKAFIMANQPHIETTMGNIATFNTDMIAPIQSAKVYFNPIQEGSGNPSPDNVRNILGWDYYMVQSGEKNNQNIVFEQVGIAVSSSRLVSATTRITSQDYIYLKTGISYRLNIVTNNPNIKLFRIYRFPIDSNKLQDYTEKLDASFPYIMSPQSTSDHEEMYKCKISLYIPGNSDISISDILEATITPVEMDTNNNEPLYINSTLFGTIMANKKNLLNPLYRDDTYAINITYYYSHSLPLPPGTYTLSCSTACDNIRVYDSIYDTLLFQQNNSTYLTFTLNKLTDVKFLFTKDSTIHSATCQLEVGSSATSYEPYKYGLFGGYIDLISGELVQTHNIITIDGTNITINQPLTSDNYYTCVAMHPTLTNYPAKINYGSNMTLCLFNYLNGQDGPDLSGSLWYNNGGYIASNTKLILKLNIPNLTTDSAVLSYLQDNPLICIYELENPITYQITPHTLKTLRGINNIWSNANGDTTVKYWTH